MRVDVSRPDLLGWVANGNGLMERWVNGADERDPQLDQEDRREDQEEREQEVSEHEGVRTAGAVAEKPQIVAHVTEQLVAVGLLTLRVRWRLGHNVSFLSLGI